MNDLTLPMEPLPQPPATPAPAESAANTPKKPDGWWSLQNLQGARAPIIAAIQANTSIPTHWRDAIIAQITSLPAEFNFVFVDAHFHIEKGNSILHLAITPDKALV